MYFKDLAIGQLFRIEEGGPVYRKVTEAGWGSGFNDSVRVDGTLLGAQHGPLATVFPVDDQVSKGLDKTTIALDIEALTMTDGYVGRFGKDWETPTPETFEKAVTGAMAVNGMTREQVIEALAEGKAVKWGQSPNYYYDHSDAIIKRRPQAKKVELVKCDCGHSVPQSLVMRASLGTSCPDCYDRMS